MQIYKLKVNVVDGKLGIEAMEVHRKRREHAERRHKNARQKMVGCLQ